jgi:hypothetical protein
MEFKTRISYKFASTLVMALALVVFGFFYADNISKSGDLIYILILLFIVIRLLFYRRYIYLLVNEKSAVVVTQNYIYDVAKDIKYYRDQVETLYEENGYLCLKLYDPVFYLSKIGDPIWRFIINFTYAPNRRKTPYKIDLDLIKISEDELAEIIDDYAVDPPENEAERNCLDFITYRFKWGRGAGFLMFQLILFSCIAALNFFGNHKNYYLSFFFLLVAIVTVLPRLIKFFYFWIGSKPVLTANRSFIFDQFKNIKYYWNDIDEIVVTGEYMVVKLYQPEKYLNKVKNPVQRYFKKRRYNRFHKKLYYSINLDIVGVKAADYSRFLNTLNEFSLTDA